MKKHRNYHTLLKGITISLASAAFVIPANCPATIITHEIVASTADRDLGDPNGLVYAANADVRVGRRDTPHTNGTAAVFPFQFPVLPENHSIIGASFSAYMSGHTAAITSNVNVYGLGFRTSDAVLLSDFYTGPFGEDSTDAWPVDPSFATPSSPDNTFLTTSSGPAETELVAYLNAQLTAGAIPGNDWVFIRLSATEIPPSGSNHRYVFHSADNVSMNYPLLTILTAPPDTVPPSIPAGLTASNITDTTVALSWSPSTDERGVTGYKVYTNGTAPQLVNTTGVTITGLLPHTLYSFSVSAYDEAGNESEQGSSIQITTARAPVYGRQILVNDDGEFVQATGNMGWLEVTHRPWVWSYDLNGWVYIETDANLLIDPGSWMYIIIAEADDPA